MLLVWVGSGSTSKWSGSETLLARMLAKGRGFCLDLIQQRRLDFKHWLIDWLIVGWFINLSWLIDSFIGVEWLLDWLIDWLELFILDCWCRKWKPLYKMVFTKPGELEGKYHLMCIQVNQSPFHSSPPTSWVHWILVGIMKWVLFVFVCLMPPLRETNNQG